MGWLQACKASLLFRLTSETLLLARLAGLLISRH